ncbi:MAG: Imm1 family immunity protein, partial [Pseudonocardia sp.]
LSSGQHTERTALLPTVDPRAADAQHYQEIFSAGMAHAEIDIDPSTAPGDGRDARRPPGCGEAKQLGLPLPDVRNRAEPRRIPDECTTSDNSNYMIVTASLTTGIARVAHGMAEAMRLTDEILQMDHVEWETTLFIGDIEFHRTKEGPFPNHQLRISVRPSAGLAAINYMDHEDSLMPIANSFNPRRPLPDIDLVFNGTTGSIFPRTSAIPIAAAREALTEWLKTRRRPSAAIQWRPYDSY